MLAAPLSSLVLVQGEAEHEGAEEGEETLRGAEAWLTHARQWSVDWGSDERRLAGVLAAARHAGFDHGVSLHGGLMLWKRN
jgi:hypothetical protein